MIHAMGAKTSRAVLRFAEAASEAPSAAGSLAVPVCRACASPLGIKGPLSDAGGIVGGLGGVVGIGVVALVGILGAVTLTLGMGALLALASSAVVLFRCPKCGKMAEARELGEDAGEIVRRRRRAGGMASLGLLVAALVCASLWYVLP